MSVRKTFLVCVVTSTQTYTYTGTYLGTLRSSLCNLTQSVDEMRTPEAAVNIARLTYWAG